MFFGAGDVVRVVIHMQQAGPTRRVPTRRAPTRRVWEVPPKSHTSEAHSCLRLRPTCFDHDHGAWQSHCHLDLATARVATHSQLCPPSHPSGSQQSNTQGPSSHWPSGNITKQETPSAPSWSPLPAVPPQHRAAQRCVAGRSYVWICIPPPVQNATLSKLSGNRRLSFADDKRKASGLFPPGGIMPVVFLSLRSPEALSSLTSNCPVWTQAELGLFPLTLTSAALSPS